MEFFQIERMRFRHVWSMMTKSIHANALHRLCSDKRSSRTRSETQRVMRAVLLLVLFVIGSAESLGLALLPALLFPRRGLSARVTRVGHLTRSGMSSVEPGNWLDNIDVDSDDDAQAAFQTCMNAFSTMDDNEGELASEYVKAVVSEAKWAGIAGERMGGGGGSRGSDTRRSNAEFKQNPRECAWWKMLLCGEDGEGEGFGCRVFSVVTTFVPAHVGAVFLSSCSLRAYTVSHKEFLVLLFCFVNDLTLLATHQLETRIESKLSLLSPRAPFLLIHGGLYLS